MVTPRVERTPTAGTSSRPAPIIWFVITFMAVLVFALVGIDSTPMLVWVVTGAAVTLVQLSLLWRRARGFTPIALVVGIVNGIAIAGAVFYPGIADQAAVSVALPTAESNLIYGIKVALAFTVAVTVGSLMTLKAHPRSNASDRDGIRVSAGLLVAIGIVPLLLGFIGRGSAFFSAPDYAVTNGFAPAAQIATALAPISELVLALALFGRSAGARLVSCLGLVAWALLHFSGSTRQLALIPGIILVGYLLSPGKRRLGPLKILVTAALTLQFSSMMLMLRGNPEGVGLWPLTRAVFDGRAATFDPAPTVGNLLFSAPLTWVSAHTPSPLGRETFVLSVTPLPGSWTEWPAVSRALRVNFATPFNGLGELAGTGLLYLVGYGLVMGLVVGLILTVTDRTGGVAGAAMFVVTTAILALFAITISQYNLRSATRFLYYLVIAAILLRMLLSRRAIRHVPGHHI